MKVAIVCDWLTSYAGAEKVLEQIINVYPEADLYALIDFISSDKRTFLHDKKAQTTFIQYLPKAKTKYRSYLPLMPLAIEQLDLSKYDLIISSSHCVSKGVLTGPDQIHVSYVHSPIRYAWDLQHQYLQESGLNHGVKGWVAKVILHYMRLWDTRTSNGVDYFIGNSNFICKRIWKCYHRKAQTIYPPVAINNFTLCEKKENFYVTASRMVPYKKIDLIVDAFTKMPEKKLIVIGDGPDFAKIKARAGRNVVLMGFQKFEVLKDYLQRAKGFVFAAEEDFGIAPVEAQACGTPVIAFGKGGVLETIIGMESSEPTGIFFKEQTIVSLCEAVKTFEINIDKFSSITCRKNAERFSEERFRNEFQLFIDGVI